MREANHEERNIALGRRSDGDHVVEAHDDVGNGHDPHGSPQMLDRLDLIVVVVFRHEQLDRDIKQRQAAHDLEPRQQHQRSDDGGKNNTKDDRYARAQDHAPDPLAMGKPATGHGDNHGVVARKEDIDPDDFQKGDPECGVAHIAPAGTDHAEPRGRIDHLSHRTHPMFLSLFPVRWQPIMSCSPWPS